MDPGLTVDVGVSPTPATVGPARVLVSVSDTVSGPPADARVAVLVRSADDRPGRVSASARAAAPGRFVAELELPRAGSWLVLVEVELPDGRRAAARQRLTVVGGPGPG